MAEEKQRCKNCKLFSDYCYEEDGELKRMGRGLCKAIHKDYDEEHWCFVWQKRTKEPTKLIIELARYDYE